MNFQKKNLILYSIVLISLGISVFLWDKIFLPLKILKLLEFILNKNIIH